jgi:hypothetical protein
MKSLIMNQVRIEQTERQLVFLRKAIADWLKARRADDRDENEQYIGRHKTQLEAIESVLLGAVKAIADQIDDLKQRIEQTDVEDAYARCRDYDETLVWVDRFWGYFRDKFDQRNDHRRFGRFLKAADEVVWSCYHQVFSTTPKHAPAPLCFVEPEYSPAAILSDQLPNDLRLKADVAYLDDFLASLPVPILRLPPWCVDSPWWLVYVGHEVGHHVQHNLELSAHFEIGLRAAAAANTTVQDEINAWGRWGEEIFADVFSIALMGPWALWAITEAEMSTPSDMLTPRLRYPESVVRIAIMKETADRLGVFDKASLRGLDLETISKNNNRAERDMAMVKTVVDFAVGELPRGLGTIQALAGFDRKVFQAGGAIENWAGLLRGVEPPAEDDLSTGRNIVSGSLCAWATISKLNHDQREPERARLAENTINVLLKSGPKGTRGDLMRDGAEPGLGRQLGEDLLQKSRSRSQGASTGGRV